MIPKRINKSIISEFRRERGQTQEKSNTPIGRGEISKPKRQSDAYSIFLRKFNDIEKSIDTFKTRDLVYYFREVAEESGYKYTISNIKKDMGIFKRLQDSYTPREICSMVEFLYKSEQDYLDKPRLSPNLLVSNWVNTIYADTCDWVEDKYIPKSKKKHTTKEWVQPIDSEDTGVGEWE